MTTRRPQRHLISAALCAFVLCGLRPGLARPQAVPRPGQPYAEAALCARSDVIFCEDFNYPQNFSFDGDASVWANPGLTTGGLGASAGTAGRSILPSAGFAAPPAGTPPEGSVWAANWDHSRGIQGDGSTWGRLREPNGAYANGSPPAADIYIRFQYYVTGNYAWPGDPRLDAGRFGSATLPGDNGILFFYPPEGVETPDRAAYAAGVYTSGSVADSGADTRFADALVVGYGHEAEGRRFFPVDATAAEGGRHLEYAPFASLSLRDPHQSPAFGKIFRVDTDRWYTIELRYKLGSAPGVSDGGIELWVDGVKVYSAFDLATCGRGAGDCSGIGAIYLGAHHNSADGTAWSGQQVLDNLVIARSYIGPPGQGGEHGTLPAMPAR